jgi:endonuclease/exonuclease/phosphatase family metal-dependent hydrolase
MDRKLQSILSSHHEKNILFRSPWAIYKIDHIIVHEAGLNKFKKIEITHCIISDHNRIKLELNNKINRRKYSNAWILNNILLN